MSEALRLSEVVKTFGSVRAVDGINLSIARGETVALLGPNGAGKSTTINMLLGLMNPTSGSVEVFGSSAEAAVRSGKVGAMLQEAAIVPNATVAEVIELSRALYPNPMSTKDILETADLTEIASRRLDKLSGGQSQRARFAFALAGNPDLLVLDEPTSAMDVASRQAFWEAMRRYAQAGRTVLFATHYLQEADDFADRIIVVGQGKVIADGSGAEIKKFAGGRIISFDLAGNGVDGLGQLAGVSGVEVRGDRVRLRCDDSDLAVRALVQSGRQFANLEITSGGLEEAFLSLTAEGER